MQFLRDECQMLINRKASEISMSDTYLQGPFIQTLYVHFQLHYLSVALSITVQHSYIHMLFLFICMESISLIVLKSLTSEYRNSPPARWQHACFSMTSNSVHSKPIGKSFVCSFMVSCYINQQLHLFLSTTSMWGSFPYTMHFPHSTFPILHLTLS